MPILHATHPDRKHRLPSCPLPRPCFALAEGSGSGALTPKRGYPPPSITGFQGAPAIRDATLGWYPVFGLSCSGVGGPLKTANRRERSARDSPQSHRREAFHPSIGQRGASSQPLTARSGWRRAKEERNALLYASSADTCLSARLPLQRKHAHVDNTHLATLSHPPKKAKVQAAESTPVDVRPNFLF